MVYVILLKAGAKVVFFVYFFLIIVSLSGCLRIFKTILKK